jgi:hypothetical protein
MQTRTTFQLYAGLLSPTALRGPIAERLVQGTLGFVFDMLAETMRAAVKSWMLGSQDYPSDALPVMGQARMLPRYPTESESAYKLRLHAAWELWAQAGSPQIIIAQLSYGLGLTALIEENHTWDWDGEPALWARMWTVITGHPWVSWTIGDGTAIGQSGKTIGSTARQADVDAVRAVVAQWKPAHVRSEHIIVVLDPGLWAAGTPPAGDWDIVTNRSAGAIYWDGQ